MVSYPRVWFGDPRTVKGGGGSGIGGIKSTMQIHEFCIVRSLKLCSFLGCKWGVPLVIGGGGGGGKLGGFGVWGFLGLFFLGCWWLLLFFFFYFIFSTILIYIFFFFCFYFYFF